MVSEEVVKNRRCDLASLPALVLHLTVAERDDVARDHHQGYRYRQPRSDHASGDLDVARFECHDGEGTEVVRAGRCRALTVILGFLNQYNLKAVF